MTTSSIPRPPLLLGWAGVLPFAALAIGAVAGLGWPVPAADALRGYGCAILSFMAGVQWGVAMRSDALERRVTGYAISVLPALVAWASLFVPLRLGLLAQAVTFAALLAYDLRTVRRGIAPDWYGSLRIQLTGAAVLCLAAAAALMP